MQKNSVLWGVEHYENMAKSLMVMVDSINQVPLQQAVDELERILAEATPKTMSHAVRVKMTAYKSLVETFIRFTADADAAAKLLVHPDESMN